MSIFTHQKTWFFIALFFIVVNIVLIAGRFMHGRGHEHSNYHGERYEGGHERWSHRDHRTNSFMHTEFIADTLQFSKEQRDKLETVEKEIAAKRDSAMQQSETCKLNFSLELYSQNPDKAKLDSLSALISKANENFNNIRIEKVFRIREICKPEQLKKFSAILSDMSKKRAGRHFHH